MAHRHYLPLVNKYAFKFKYFEEFFQELKDLRFYIASLFICFETENYYSWCLLFILAERFVICSYFNNSIHFLNSHDPYCVLNHHFVRPFYYCHHHFYYYLNYWAIDNSYDCLRDLSVPSCLASHHCVSCHGPLLVNYFPKHYQYYVMSSDYYLYNHCFSQQS